MEQPNLPAKTYALTLNNYIDSDITFLKDLEGISLMTVGIEGKSATPHLQIAITWRKPKRWNNMKKLFPKYHIEKAKCIDSCHNYCMKEGDYFIIDNRSKQGKRSDLDKVAELIKEDCSLEDIAKTETKTFIRYYNNIVRTHELLNPKYRNFKPKVTWIYGPTGVGKTRYVVSKFELKDIWISGRNLKWWEGYRQQRVTLIDDFRSDFCTFHELLRILDSIPFFVEFKCGSTQLNSEYIFITCPYHPNDVYKTIEDKGQLIRRIDEIIELSCAPPIKSMNEETVTVTEVSRR